MELTDSERRARDLFAAGYYIVYDVVNDRFKWTAHARERALYKDFAQRLLDNQLAQYIETDVKTSRYKLIGPGRCMLIKLKSCKKSRG